MPRRTQDTTLRKGDGLIATTDLLNVVITSPVFNEGNQRHPNVTHCMTLQDPRLVQPLHPLSRNGGYLEQSEERKGRLFMSCKTVVNYLT